VADFFARYGHFSDGTNRAGVVHRLDRDTSGIIIGARTEAAAQFLKEQFANRLVKKTYVAISSPPPKNQEMVIDVPIARSHSKPGEYTVRAEGKPAQTALKVVQQNDKLAYLELSPKTGRTHQLRVHLQYIGSPIVGDRLYGNKAAERLFLHAKELTLTLPSGAQKTFSAPVPPEFLDYLSSQGLHAR
jgi:23S rRNA pseudouridine1911/1915/1917 synthase